MTTRIKYLCNECGSDELIFDTTSSWNPEDQTWELEGEYDHNPCCNSETCQGEETTFHTIDLTTGEQIKAWAGEWLSVEDYDRRLNDHMRAQRDYRNGQKAIAQAVENATILGQALQIIDGKAGSVQS